MKNITIEEFMSSQGFDLMQPTLRRNENDYPFLTFIKLNDNPEVNGGRNIAENVYFYKVFAERCEDIKTGTLVDGEFIKSLRFTYSDTESNGKLWKIGDTRGAALSLEDMMQMMKGL